MGRRRLALAFALLAAGCGGATVRRPVAPDQQIPVNVAQLRWRVPLNQQGLFEPRPEECATGTVVDGRLVIGSRAGKIVGLHVDDGRVLWTTPASGGIDGEARFDATRRHVYLGADDGNFYAINPEDGVIRWSYKAKGAIERVPEIGGDAVYLSTATDRVLALEARTGKWRWQYERETPEGFTIHGHSGPRLKDGIIYTGFSDGFLVALQAGSGEVVWARSLAGASDQFVDVDATPVLVGDTLIASSYSGGLYALRARDGDVRWRLAMEGASAFQFAHGRLYVAAPREGIGALTTEGHVLWRQGLADAGDLTPPIAVGPYLVFSGTRAGLFIVERSSGKLLQLFNPGRGACASAAVDSGDGRNVYLLANSGWVYALQLRF